MANIGSGKFGTVYQGYDKTNGRMVALKFITNNKQESWKKEI
jgi:serine/threonine protein kinase